MTRGKGLRCMKQHLTRTFGVAVISVSALLVVGCTALSPVYQLLGIPSSAASSETLIVASTQIGPNVAFTPACMGSDGMAFATFPDLPASFLVEADGLQVGETPTFVYDVGGRRIEVPASVAADNAGTLREDISAFVQSISP
jgi:hypothetical protein